MSEVEPGAPHEIVIVRRRGDGDHDDHHGGVWKVAFADFMTAMMAFFLVLWIVNSTTKQTRSSLARYFNPIRLSDTTPARKGLNDPREVDFDASAVEHRAGDAKSSSETPSKQIDSKIDAVPIEPVSAAKNAGDAHKSGYDAATRMQDEFADPFAGMRRRQLNAPASTGDKAMSDVKEEEKAEAVSMRRAIDAELGEDRAADLKSLIEVSAVSDGLLISLTDGADLGTFAIGSSQPEERLTHVLSAIAEVLKTTKGTVVVRGHTDTRPYRKGKSDNWTLSFARAQTAFLGLVRSGFDERRIERVEGHADRKLKNASTPQGPENRRIEILLRRTP
ncbi:MAG: OmpA family protein [Rhodoblastus sp.]|nr:OmpA family protein [Rhodoblastus sp.]